MGRPVATSLVACFAIAFGVTAAARDLGVFGPTYPISEPDLLQEITRSLKEKERSGELARLTAQMKSQAIARVETPVAVHGVTRASKASVHYIDPSITVEDDIRDQRGVLIAAKGTRRNPLDVIPMTSSLVFFDGTNRQEAAYVQQLIKTHGRRIKPILVAGSPKKLMEAWSTPVFFDQQGALVERLAIRETPAVVRQEGRLLRVDVGMP